MSSDPLGESARDANRKVEVPNSAPADSAIPSSGEGTTQPTPSASDSELTPEATELVADDAADSEEAPEEQTYAEEDSAGEGDGQETWGDGLPPPPDRSGRSPLAACFLTLLVCLAVAAGLAVTAASFYVVVIYNLIIGVLIGAAMARAPIRSGYTRSVPLLIGTAFFCLFVYVLYHGFQWLWLDWRSSLAALSHLPPEEWWRSFRMYLDRQARLPLMGYDIGEQGNYVRWSMEFCITFLSAWPMVRTAIRYQLVREAPVETLEEVVGMMKERLSDRKIRKELSEFGWTETADQDFAIAAGRAYLRLVRKKR